MSDWKETSEANESEQASDSGLSKEGIQSMQGQQKETKSGANEADSPLSSIVVEEGGKQVPLEDYYQPPYDPAKLKYETRSPHEDYQNYKDLTAAQRQHELGQQAATAESLPDALNTTLSAHKEAQSDEESPMDEWFYKKYGRTPYTTEVYPKKDE